MENMTTLDDSSQKVQWLVKSIEENGYDKSQESKSGSNVSGTIYEGNFLDLKDGKHRSVALGLLKPNELRTISFSSGQEETWEGEKTLEKLKKLKINLVQVSEKDVRTQQSKVVEDNSTQIQEEALRSENTTKIITNDSVDIQIDIDAPITNIADTMALMSQMSENSESYSDSELEAETIKNVDEAMPEMNVEEQQLSLDLFEELSTEYPSIENFWESDIAHNIEASKALRQNNNIVDLEDLIKEYENSTKTGATEQEKQDNFIEQIKKCNL
jgi:hypothetical protein